MDDLLERMMEREHGGAMNGFYKHFLVFAVVIGLLAIINLATSDKFWLHWVVLGWGLGLALHAFLVFVRRPQREAKVQALVDARRAQKAQAAGQSQQPPST